MSDSRREFYRVIYPLDERPTVTVGRLVHAVVDCSERGLRYEVKDRRVPQLGAEFKGRLRFRRGAEILVNGEVIRARSGLVVVKLDPPLPFGEILSEQRYLRGKGYTLRD